MCNSREYCSIIGLIVGIACFFGILGLGWFFICTISPLVIYKKQQGTICTFNTTGALIKGDETCDVNNCWICWRSHIPVNYLLKSGDSCDSTFVTGCQSSFQNTLDYSTNFAREMPCFYDITNIQTITLKNVMDPVAIWLPASAGIITAVLLVIACFLSFLYPLIFSIPNLKYWGSRKTRCYCHGIVRVRLS